jgi:hypothetical protein
MVVAPLACRFPTKPLVKGAGPIQRVFVGGRHIVQREIQIRRRAE